MGRSAVRSPQAWREFDRTATFIAGGLSVSLAALTLAGYSPFSAQPSPPPAVEQMQPVAPEQPAPAPVAVGGENTPPAADLREAMQGAGPPLIKSEPRLVERTPKSQEAADPIQPAAADPAPVEPVPQEKTAVALETSGSALGNASNAVPTPSPAAETPREVDARADEPARPEKFAADSEPPSAGGAAVAASPPSVEPTVVTKSVEPPAADAPPEEDLRSKPDLAPAVVADAKGPAVEAPVPPPAPTPAVRKKPLPPVADIKPASKPVPSSASTASVSQQPASQPVGKKTAAVQPSAATAPPNTSPTAPQSSVAYRKNADAVHVYGRVKSQEERDEVLKAASETFSRKVVDHVVIDDKVAPLKHRAKLNQAVGLVQNVDGTARIQIDGDTVSISGRIESESQRQRYLEEAGKVFGPGVKIEDRLKPAGP